MSKPSFHAVLAAAETVFEKAELPVVHVHAAVKGNALGVDPELVSLENMIVEHGAEEIVCRADRVKVAREMEIDVLHRHDLRIAAARSSPLDPEHGAERGLAKCDDDPFADSGKPVGKADGSSRLALACGGGGDRRHKDEFALFAAAVHDA